MTIFLTTQYLEEADSLAGRVAIIDGGKIATEGTPQGLKAQLGGESINLTFENTSQIESAQQLLSSLGGQHPIDRMQVDQLILRLYLRGAAVAVPGVIGALENANLRPSMLTLSQPTLDDVFLQVTGHRYERQPQLDS
jgi:ABC-2 type transport system ATP-binding protein